MSVHIESSLRINGVLDSRIGGRPDNQDSAGFTDTPLGTIVVICDGMGGCNGGAVASKLAVTTIIDDVACASEDSSPSDVLRNAIVHANEVIFSKAAEDSSLRGMGTTVVAVLISEKCVLASYVGDSRIYLLRGRKKIFRTFDHSYVYQVLVNKGVLTEEQARLSAQSNTILKALGVESSVDPEIVTLPYLKGDRLLLCTDGFWGVMPEPALLSLVSRGADLDSALEQAFMKVENLGITAGGCHDNYSAALIELGSESLMRSKMDNRTKILVAALSVCLVASLALNVFMFNGARCTESSSEAQQVDSTAVPQDSSKVNETPKMDNTQGQ